MVFGYSSLNETRQRLTKIIKNMFPRALVSCLYHCWSRRLIRTTWIKKRIEISTTYILLHSICQCHYLILYPLENYFFHQALFFYPPKKIEIIIPHVLSFFFLTHSCVCMRVWQLNSVKSHFYIALTLFQHYIVWVWDPLKVNSKPRLECRFFVWKVIKRSTCTAKGPRGQEERYFSLSLLCSKPLQK